jgi:hypothetical protein
MRKPFLLLVVLCLAATLAAAQTQSVASVCEIHVNKVKAGMTPQYEQARAKHMAWHKGQNDSWSWAVWEITTGEGTGNYLVGSCGHDWKDFDGRDKFQVADSTNANSTMGPYLASETMGYYVQRPDLSPATASGPPPPYLSVTHFFLRPEGVLDFNDGVKKASAAMAKAMPNNPSNWYSLANGGRGPEVVLVRDLKSISELQGVPGKTVDQIVQEAYGDQGAAVMVAIRKAYDRSYSELLHFRPDLSYMPTSAKP